MVAVNLIYLGMCMFVGVVWDGKGEGKKSGTQALFIRPPGDGSVRGSLGRALPDSAPRLPH